MNPRSISPAITAMLRVADTLGVAIPKDVRADLEAAVAAVDAASTLTPADLAGLVADVIAAGKDPLSDKGVQAAALSHHILSACGPAGIADRLAERAAAVAKECAPAVVAAFRPRYAELGRLLAEDCDALAAAGIDSLDQAGLSVRAGTEAAAAHSRALSTMRALAGIDAALVPIRALAGSDASPVGMVVQFVDAPAASAAELRQHGKPSYWDVVSEGWVLDLADPDEAAARHTRAYEIQARYQRAAEQAQGDAMRARYGTGRPITV